MEFFPFKNRKVHFIFKDLFIYSFCSINPEKYSRFFNQKVSTVEDISRIKNGLVKSLRSKDLKGKDYEVSAKELFSFYTQISRSPLGRTVLKEGGKKLGHVLGKNINEVYFEEFISTVQDSFSKLNIGKFSVLKKDSLSISIEIPKHLFSNLTEKKCHFFEGMFEGLLESYTNTPWIAVETSCSSLGDNRCVFECRNI